MDLAGALSPAPYSGYARAVKKNYPDSVGYAHVYLYAPESQAVRLWLGYNDGIRVWLNGAPKYTDNADYRWDAYVEHDIVPDQTRVDLDLRAGWNRLLLKLSQDAEDEKPGVQWGTDNSWKFSAKIRDARGRTIRGENLLISLRNLHVTVSLAGSNTMNITWNQPALSGQNIETYTLDVATNENFTKLVKKDLDMGLVTSYTIKGLPEGKRLFFRVKPCGYDGRGPVVLWHEVDIVETKGQVNP